MIKLEMKGLDAALKDVSRLAGEVEKRAQKALSNFGTNVEATAKELAPADEGRLRNSINADDARLQTTITVAVDYAAYMEFGTRKFAAAYVGTLPADWQSYAATFKGKGGGTFKEFLAALVEWVRKKGLGSGFVGNKGIGVAGTYSVKTRKRTGNKATQQQQNESAAYVIALSILRKGVRPQPFLYPAVKIHSDDLQNEMKNIIDG